MQDLISEIVTVHEEAQQLLYDTKVSPMEKSNQALEGQKGMWLQRGWHIIYLPYELNHRDAEVGHNATSKYVKINIQ